MVDRETRASRRARPRRCWRRRRRASRCLSPCSARWSSPASTRSLAQAEAVEVGVDGDHVDLAERRLVVGVHLGPAEAGEAAVALVQQEAVRVEPRLGLARLERLDVPAALLGVLVRTRGCSPRATPPRRRRARNGRVVERRCGAPAGSGRRIWSRSRPRAQAGGGGDLVVVRRRLGDPQVDVAAALVATIVERGVQQLAPDRACRARGGAGRRRAPAPSCRRPRLAARTRRDGHGRAPMRRDRRSRRARPARGRATCARQAGGGRRPRWPASSSSWTDGDVARAHLPLDLNLMHGGNGTVRRRCDG